MRKCNFIYISIIFSLLLGQERLLFAQNSQSKNIRSRKIINYSFCEQLHNLSKSKKKTQICYKAKYASFSSKNHWLVEKVINKLKTRVSYEELIYHSYEDSLNKGLKINKISPIVFLQKDEQQDIIITYSEEKKWKQLVCSKQDFTEMGNFFYVFKTGKDGVVDIYGSEPFLSVFYVIDSSLVDTRSNYKTFGPTQGKINKEIDISVYKTNINLIKQKIDSISNDGNGYLSSYMFLLMPLYFEVDDWYVHKLNSCGIDFIDFSLEFCFSWSSYANNLFAIINRENYNLIFKQRLLNIIQNNNHNIYQIINFYYIYLSFIMYKNTSFQDEIKIIKTNIQDFNPILHPLIQKL